MIRITIQKTNPVFIAAVKAERAAAKEKFAKYFATIRRNKAK